MPKNFDKKIYSTHRNVSDSFIILLFYNLVLYGILMKSLPENIRMLSYTYQIVLKWNSLLDFNPKYVFLMKNPQVNPLWYFLNLFYSLKINSFIFIL